MKIEADEEAKNILKNWSDIVLRSMGLQAMNDVNKVLICIAGNKDNKSTGKSNAKKQ